MNSEQTPLKIDGISESIYAGFWARLGSLLLDTVFMLPVVFLALYLNGFGKNYYFYTFIPLLAFELWYNIYLPKKYGGTPGKLAVGIMIIRLDGQPIDWKESILRYSVLLVLSILNTVMMTSCLLKADDATFNSLGWMQRSQYLVSLSPLFFRVYLWVSNIWVYGEFFVLLTNKRKRAIHDYIAGTVIVKSKYIDNIRETMNPTSNTPDGDIGINLLPDLIDQTSY